MPREELYEKPSPRIMVVLAAAAVTGPAKGIFQMIVSLRNKGCDFFLYNFKRGGKKAQAEPIDFIKTANDNHIPVHLFDQQSRSPLPIVRQAMREARRRSIDIVQTHGYKPGFIGLCLKILCGIKWICFMHGTTTIDAKDRFYHLLDHSFQLFADRVVLVSKSQAVKLPMGNNRTRIKIIHNAIDSARPAAFSSPAAQAGASNPGLRPFVITYIGRLSPEKGVDILLRAIALLNGADVKTIIVGDGPEREKLLGLSQKLGLDDRVIFAGFSPTPGDFMKDTDAFVLPSRSEGIPNVILEAMALKKPVIATKVGGVPEIVRHEHDGLLVPAEDPGSLALAIVRLIADPVFAQNLADNGFKTVNTHFTVERRNASILDLYREVLS